MYIYVHLSKYEFLKYTKWDVFSTMYPSATDNMLHCGTQYPSVTHSNILYHRYPFSPMAITYSGGGILMFYSSFLRLNPRRWTL